jgi:hypothetical protein
VKIQRKQWSLSGQVSQQLFSASQKTPLTPPLDTVEDVQSVDGSKPSRYHVTFRHDNTDLSDVHRYPRVLDFSTFTTQGLRRFVGEARLVTPAKLLALITAISEGLMAFGASSNMDSALSLEVLESLLFRDGDMITPAQHSLRGVSMERSRDRNERSPRRLQALDLCDCTSPSFEAALTKFVEKHLRKFSGRATSTVDEESDDQEGSSGVDEDERRGRGRSRAREMNSDRPASQTMTMSRSKSAHRSSSGAPSKHPARATLFPSVLRLGLCGVHFSPDLLSPFVLAFNRLTHLDLSGTKADEMLLRALSASPDIELESLSLARCTRVTSTSLTELLVDSPVCTNLIELSLEGSLLYPTPLNRTDLETIITSAPFIRSGSLRYLDLGACGLDDTLLAAFPKQPALLDLGLSASPYLTLTGVAHFLMNKAPNIQVLELVDSCQSTGPMSMLQLNIQLLDPCTTTPAMSISEQLAAMGYRRSLDGQTETSTNVRNTAQAKTNLRVVGLSVPILNQVQGSLGSWNVILGAGKRGWLVDISSGPNPEAVDEDLEGSDDDDEVEHQWHSSLRVSRRGRQSIEGSWEPETPPRRLSRSPSSSMKRGPASIFMKRQGSGSHSRSRSRALPRSSLSNKREEEEEEEEKEESPMQPRAEVIRNLARNHPRRLRLEQLAKAKGHVIGSTGWHSKKMEVLLGMGMLGREGGSYAYAAYQS